MTDEGDLPAPPSYEEAVCGPYQSIPRSDGAPSIMPPYIAGTPHPIPSAPMASGSGAGDLAGPSGAYGGGMGGSSYTVPGAGDYRGAMEPAKVPLPGDRVQYTTAPTISDSPHSSDDEETVLLKRELRRVREDKLKQKKLLLQQEINHHRNQSGYSTLPSSARPTGQPHTQPQYGAAGGVSGSAPDMSVPPPHPAADSVIRPGVERYSRMQIRDRKFRYADVSSTGIGVYIAARPLSGDICWFEIEIRECGPKNSIVIGLVPQEYPLDVQPGLLPYSVGYHMSDGVFVANGRGIRLPKKCYPGCRMGCGIDIQNCSLQRKDDTVKVFLTRNGKKVGEVRALYPEGGLFPAISMSSYGDEVKLMRANIDDGHPVNIRGDQPGTEGVENETESSSKGNFAVGICCLALVGVIGLLALLSLVKSWDVY